MSRNLISVENLQKEFPEKTICQNETFGIHEGDKIGIVGINGCGKSTLLKMLTNNESCDEGKITFRNGITIDYLPQIPDLNPDFTILDQIYHSDNIKFDLLRKYYQINTQLENHPSNELRNSQAKLIQEIDAVDGWEIEIKAKRFLTKLGFKEYKQKIKYLSGGQKRRIDLARVLMDQPDILVMDEPTNHLDIDIIEWLQDYLADYSGTLIFVTHDRYFLDTVSNKIMELEKGKIKFYEGNYSYYLEKKNLEEVDLQRKETRRTSQLKKEMKWLQRGARARTSKPKNHIERVKELLEKSYLTNDKDLDISFQTKRLGKTILNIQNLTKSFTDDDTLFTNFNHIFQKMERIGIIGSNGCGKTTLLKIISGEETPNDGKIKIGVNTHLAYFKQDNDEFNHSKLTVLEYIQENAQNIRTEDGVLHGASEMLQKFLFDKKMQQSKISSLSGGERKRLYLLKSLMFGSNFLILDEPTNDLDIRTLEILEDYLDAYKGCLLTVSHDRFFLDRVTDYLFIFEGDKIIKFPGNYSDYLLLKRFKEAEQKEIELKERKINKNQAKTRTNKKLSYKESKELSSIEEEIAELESMQSETYKIIEEKAASMDHAEFQKLSKKLNNIENDMSQLMDRWTELEEKRISLETSE